MKRFLSRRGFTITELLVSLVIIAVLLTILITGITRAQITAKATTCMANMRQLGGAFLAFGADNGGRLPGCHSQITEGGAGQDLEPLGFDPTGEPLPKNPANFWKRDWLSGMDRNYGNHSITDQANKIGFYSQPTRGSIFMYVTSAKIYLCPVLGRETFGVGYGSNGQYDYTFPQCLSGARVGRVARTATATSGPLGTSTVTISFDTPVLVEEDPANFLNSGMNLDGAWCWWDCTTYNHLGGTNIMTLDGSCYPFKPPANFSLRAAEVIMRSSATNSPRDGKTDTTPFGWMNSW
jgi:prepilin-type N-terminal cleavage/methylation domain-containing protein